MQLFSDKRQTPLFIADDEIAISSRRAYTCACVRACVYARERERVARREIQKLSIFQDAGAMARELQIREARQNFGSRERYTRDAFFSVWGHNRIDRPEGREGRAGRESARIRKPKNAAR